MPDKSLKDKAIKYEVGGKKKDYVLVADRILFFNDNYPNGKIETELVSHETTKFIIKAKVTPDATKPERYFTGYSQADETQGFVNKTAALENSETSAVGRALAMMGIGVLDSVASVDEMRKAGVKDQVSDAFNPSAPGMPDVTPTSLGVCKKCGAKMIVYKSGTVGCSDYCWKNKTV